MPLSANLFQKKLLAWYDQHGRHRLPWQQNKTPYRVWISEVMLQQTQVATVIPYFERFMKSFPTVTALAKAHEDEVLHHWAGLGYYSRARNLHRAANMIVKDFKGQFPNTPETLTMLPGVGESTCGAILSIAFGQRAPILDGNVKRVLSRIHGITTPIKDTKTIATLWEIASINTPQKRVADYTQAMMDLGATLCTRSKPLCHTCPFQSHCHAFLNGMTTQIPVLSANRKVPTKEASFLLLEHENNILLMKRPSSGIWGGLYCLPQLDEIASTKEIRSFCKTHFGIPIKKINALTAFKHTFTHYHLILHPVHLPLQTKPLGSIAAIWYNPANTHHVGLPKPIQTILKEFYDTRRLLPKAQKRSTRV